MIKDKLQFQKVTEKLSGGGLAAQKISVSFVKKSMHGAISCDKAGF